MDNILTNEEDICGARNVFLRKISGNTKDKTCEQGRIL